MSDGGCWVGGAAWWMRAGASDHLRRVEWQHVLARSHFGGDRTLGRLPRYLQGPVRWYNSSGLLSPLAGPLLLFPDSNSSAHSHEDSIPRPRRH